MQLQSILNGMLYVLIGFAAGAVVTLAVLGPLILSSRRRSLSNQRRIERVELRQKTHGFAIRQLVEEAVDPDDPEPPPGHRRGARIFKGAAGIGVVALLARRHPIGAGLTAAGAAVGAAVLAVTLTPMQAQGGPDAAGLQAPSSPVASYSAPAAAPSTRPPRPSASTSQPATTSAIPAPVMSSPAVETPQPTPSQPLLVVSLPPVSASVALPLPSLTVPALPTTSLLPSAPVSVPPPSVPHPSHSGTPCVVDLSLPPLLQVCLLGNGK